MRVQVTIDLDDEQRAAFAQFLKCGKDAKSLAPKVRNWMLEKCEADIPEIMEPYLEGRLKELRQIRPKVEAKKQREKQQ